MQGSHVHAPSLPVGHYLKRFDPTIQPFILQTQNKQEHSQENNNGEKIKQSTSIMQNNPMVHKIIKTVPRYHEGKTSNGLKSRVGDVAT